MEEDHKEKKEEVKKTKHRKIKFGTWKILTIILAILVVVAIFTKGFSFISITGMSAKDAADKAINFINQNLLQGQTATLQSVEEDNNMYKITIMIDSQTYDSYITKDGKLLFTSVIDMDELAEEIENTETPQTQLEGMTKTNKPKVELFIMSHCPYGTQAEKGIIPVVNLLKDKIDFSIKYVYYAMHGKKELDEQTLQYCIQKEQNDKFLDYLYCFLEDEQTQACLEETKVDQTKLDSCIESTDKEFKITEQFEDESTWLSGRFPRFDVDKELNEKYSIGGSPTLVINGVTASSNRDPASYLKTICSAFTQQPSECSGELSTQAPSPGFGFGTTGAASAGSCA